MFELKAALIAQYMPDELRRRTSPENVADALYTLDLMGARIDWTAARVPVERNEANVTGEDDTLRAAAAFLTSSSMLTHIKVEGVMRNRAWVAKRLLDSIEHARAELPDPVAELKVRDDVNRVAAEVIAGAGKSRADALTAYDLLAAVTQRPDLSDAARETFRRDVLERNDEITLCGDDFRAMANLLAASPVEQHEAAPADEQVCQHCDCTYPLHDLDCPVAVEASKRAAQPEPPAADERAAFVKFWREVDEMDQEEIARAAFTAGAAFARASSPNAAGAEVFTYATKQATACASCGEHKHTPLRIDWMGGYVCLTCIDRELESRAPRTEVAEAVPRSVIFSLECTANWLEGGCDPKAAAHEIRLNLEKLRAPSADAAAAPSDERAAFEAWIKNEAKTRTLYTSDWVAAWEGWQARAAAEQPAAPAMTNAARDVLAERERQVNVEGWTPEHDDKYANGELSAAAGSYALHAHDRRIALTPAWWPWERKWWKPGTPRQMLVKAGALILAAIERIDRDDARHEALEREHLGDPDKRTGIYAERDAKPVVPHPQPTTRS